MTVVTSHCLMRGEKQRALLYTCEPKALDRWSENLAFSAGWITTSSVPWAGHSDTLFTHLLSGVNLLHTIILLASDENQQGLFPRELCICLLPPLWLDLA